MSAFIAWFTAKRRKYIYLVVTAALVLAGGYGLMSAEEVQAWTSFLGVALVTGMAAANTKPETDE